MNIQDTLKIYSFYHIIVLIMCVNHSVYGADRVTKVTNYGKVQGLIQTVYSGNKVEKYLGIPYARPPLGNLRFEAPVPPQPWGNKILKTIELSPACPQPAEGVSYIELHVPGFNKTNEDCLYLNIYTPRNYKSNSRLPVMFYVHGGSYFNGMGAMFDGSSLATEGVVVVTFNYRLGPLGFLSVGDSNLPGNYGMMDMIAALKWVQENIMYFNGDPNQVTIDGHSAGGCAVGFLMLSPLTKGLFRTAIIQSGSPLAHWSYSKKIRRPDMNFKIFASSFGCLSNSSQQIKLCLQSVSTERMYHQISLNYVTSPSLSPQFRPVVDGYFLPDIPERLIQAGSFHVESVMMGATRDEGLIAALPLIQKFAGDERGIKQLITLMYCFRGDLPQIPEIVDLVLEEYSSWPFLGTDENVEAVFSEIVGDYYITAPTHRLAQLLSYNNISVYLYNYEYKSIYNQWNGVIHGSEVFYLSGFPMTGHANFRYDGSDKKMSKLLLQMWSNFMKNGLPSLVPHQSFYVERYSIKYPVYAKIISGINQPLIEMTSNYKPYKLDLWNRRIPTIYNKNHLGVYDRENFITKNYVITGPNSWALIATCIGLAVLVVFFSVGYCKTKTKIQKLTRQNSVNLSNEIISKKDINHKYPKTNV